MKEMQDRNDELARIGSSIDRKRFARALDLAIEMIRSMPKSIDLHFHLFDALFGLKRYVEAERHARAIVRLNPLERNAHLNVGAALEMQQKNTLALKHYRLELELNPESVGAHHNCGTHWARKRQWKRACPLYR
ncbi:MAG: tetratricopeptide (TPR) repeat protein [Verrucomicrobiales bacterium]|jgi:tetratricopeptide (TPR) repeat protein